MRQGALDRPPGARHGTRAAGQSVLSARSGDQAIPFKSEIEALLNGTAKKKFEACYAYHPFA